MTPASQPHATNLALRWSPAGDEAGGARLKHQHRAAPSAESLAASTHPAVPAPTTM